ncbi:MAG: EVE domain-containing protein [Candidatus Ryanbacteria bacterium CG10_big_fil_rev_8_21_14_0_10_43_42]|uniref:EVE domain-containing protein n=1 Tax=Candidatus Ryanbacteria bacterium CG10_big_fil_rev_8_21_14_0_10_43_42 TaxID=1974864 RepID=A0A2M8KWG8_9BACT|nr:MAG: EVE domain-containing protein [Candidatus Ryanbacteria bacterium CG10_big_fil_rev_8_21_14_0_10_43_42]
MNYWLFKSEPRSYSIDDLARDTKTFWDGVRNYQARNFMRDDMHIGDRIFFYHSNADPSGIVGLAEVTSEAYPDQTAFDKMDHHYDPKSKKDNPAWYGVDIMFCKKFSRTISLEEIKNTSAVKDMLVARRGMRLSVMPVEEKHAMRILAMAS